MAFSHVEDRLKNALDYVDHEKIPVTSLIVVGGVAANLELRRYALQPLKSNGGAVRVDSPSQVPYAQSN